MDAAQTALVVLDCQPEGLNCLATSDELIVHTVTAVDTVRRHGGHIAFVRTAFDDLDYRFVPSTNTEVSALARRRAFQNGSPEAAFHPAMPIRANDIVVRKTRLGMFSTTNLDERLTNLGVTTLIVSGIHTSGAVLSTIREAADRDYRVIVLSDCTADSDADAHELVLNRVIGRQAEILTTGELDRCLARGALRRNSESPVG